MKKLQVILLLVFLICFIDRQARAQDSSNVDMSGMNKHIMLNKTDLQFEDGPLSLPSGAKISVLQGDPSKEGPFVVRLEFPADYQIPAHWHPATENVTVLKGSLYMGSGERLDTANAKLIETGGFASMPAKSPHYVFTKDGCTVQVHAMGPFKINYINPADDPSKKINENQQ